MRNRLDMAFLAAVFASIATCVGAAEPPADELETITLPPRPRCVTGEPRTFEQSCAYLDRRDAVAAAEAGTKAAALAGIYDFSTGMIGAELALATDGWAGYREFADAGVSQGITGRYRERDGRLVVDLDRSTGGPDGVSRLEYVVVRWGSRVFLIPPGALAGFIATLDREGLEGTSRIELRDYLQRRRQRDDALCGLLELPPDRRGYLHPDPLRMMLADARIDAAPTSNPYLANVRRYVVTIDAGSADGVFAGMWLEGDPAQFPGADIFGQVDDVEPHRARGHLSILGDRAKAPVAGVSIGKGTSLASGRGWKPDACATVD